MPDRDWWRTAPTKPSAAGATGAAVALIAGYALVSSIVEHPFRIGLAIALAAGMFVIARRSAVTADDMGLGRDRLGTGLWWGVPIAAIAVGAITAIALLPLTRSFFQDDR